MMSSYKKSSLDTGKFNQSDIPTATKTNYLQTSPYLATPSLKSPNRYQSRLQGVRESISSMISQMHSKKSENNNAVQRVRNVNSDAIGVLREQQNNYTTYTPKKSQRTNCFPRQNRTIGGTQVYPHYPQAHFNEQGQTNPSDFNLFPEDNKPDINFSSNFNPLSTLPQLQGPKSLQQQNIQLRRALNEQIRINGQLMKRVNQLQNENYQLRNHMANGDSINVNNSNNNGYAYGNISANGKGLRSTRYGTNSFGGETDLNLSGRYGSPVGGKFGSENYIQSSYSPNQNRGYGQGQSQGYQSYGQNQGYDSLQQGGEYSSLFAELDHLKRQNESLRQNTIGLLQKN